jgi:septal ring factor EnvC (AmiA/AmiB activator)
MNEEWSAIAGQVVTLIVGVAGGAFAYRATSKTVAKEEKRDQAVTQLDQFSSIMKANAEFRDEIRRDLKSTKDELEVAKKLILTLQGTIEKVNAKNTLLSKMMEISQIESAVVNETSSFLRTQLIEVYRQFKREDKIEEVYRVCGEADDRRANLNSEIESIREKMRQIGS